MTKCLAIRWRDVILLLSPLDALSFWRRTTFLLKARFAFKFDDIEIQDVYDSSVLNPIKQLEMFTFAESLPSLGPGGMLMY